jgi:putative ABC transport system ATP-binding protein
VHELADGGEELVKVAGPGTISAKSACCFTCPARRPRARTDATVVGCTAPVFRERLGAGGVRDLIEHRKLATE